jgi:hypothetical protein
VIYLNKDKKEILNRLNYHIANAYSTLEEMYNSQLALSSECADGLRVPPLRQPGYLPLSFDNLTGLVMLYIFMNAFGVLVLGGELVMCKLNMTKRDKCHLIEARIVIRWPKHDKHRQRAMKCVQMCHTFLCESTDLHVRLEECL